MKRSISNIGKRNDHVLVPMWKGEMDFLEIHDN